MKNYKTLSIVSMLTISLVSNSIGLTAISMAQAAEPTAGFTVVAKEIKKANKAIALGQPSDKTIATFANALVEQGVTSEDVDSYVKATTSPAEYDRYENSVKNALAGASVATNSKEFANVVAMALNAGANNGLAWESCGAKIGGWIAIGAAVIVGIVALTKTKGAQKISQDYQQQEQARTNQYQNDQNYVANYNTVIPQLITADNAKIQSNNQQIAYLNGQNSALDPASAAYQNNVSAIASLNQSNSDLTAQIQQYTNDIVYYSNPDNRAAALAQLKTVYDTDMANLQANEQTDVSLVPRNKKLAGTLGIVAGTTAAIGAVLVIGSKCN